MLNAFDEILVGNACIYQSLIFHSELATNNWGIEHLSLWTQALSTTPHYLKRYNPYIRDLKNMARIDILVDIKAELNTWQYTISIKGNYREPWEKMNSYTEE